MTTTSILKSKDKTINEIKQILASTKAKFLSKRVRNITGDLAIMFWGHRKATSKNRYFNCQKLEHFGRDCRSTVVDPQPSNLRKRTKPEESIKQQKNLEQYY